MPLLMELTTFASGKGRLIQKLIEGDPVAWAIVGGMIGIVVLIVVVQKARSAGKRDSEPADEVKHIRDDQNGRR